MSTTASAPSVLPPERLIISMPNQPAERGGRILAIETIDQVTTMRWIDADLPNRTTYGLTTIGNHIMSVSSDNTPVSDRRHVRGQSYLTIFDAKDLSVIDSIPMKGVNDVHSVCRIDNDLLVVATATDEVMRVNPSTGATEIVYSASNTKREENHLNSILNTGSTVLVSGFGPRKDSSWHSTGDGGFVQDIFSGAYMARGLHHPHSLARWNNHTIICESSPSMLVRDLDNDEVLWTGTGYLRGLVDAGNDTLLVGLNVGRVSSEKPGMILHRADPGELVGSAAVVCVSFDSNQQTSSHELYNLKAYGNEIYDILVA